MTGVQQHKEKPKGMDITTNKFAGHRKMRGMEWGIGRGKRLKLLRVLEMHGLQTTIKSLRKAWTLTQKLMIPW